MKNLNTLPFSLLLLLALPSFASAQEYGKPADEPAPAPEKAEETPTLTLQGASFLARYEVRQNYSEIGKQGRRIGELDGTAYRARFVIGTTPIDLGNERTLTLTLAPQASGFFGDASPKLVDAGLSTHEAYMKLSGNTWNVQVGRFEMAYGDHLVIGNVGWHETGRSFDGIRMRGKLAAKKTWVDVFSTQVHEGINDSGSPKFAAGDIYFTGVYAALGGFLAEDLDLDTYALGRIWAGSFGSQGDSTDVEFTLGTRVKKKVSSIALRAEAGMQAGTRPNGVSVLAFQGDGDAFVDLGGTAKLGLGVLYASGNDTGSTRDTSWNQLFPTAHKFLGLADIIDSRSNVMAAAVKFRGKAGDSVKLAADAHLFLRPETAAGVDSYTGVEGDFWAVYLLGKGLGLRGQYSIFLPNQSGPFATDTPIHYVEAQLRYDM